MPPPLKAPMKCHLRSTMCDSRLSNIAVMSIESARAESLSLDIFVDEFDSKHQNRKLALHRVSKLVIILCHFVISFNVVCFQFLSMTRITLMPMHFFLSNSVFTVC